MDALTGKIDTAIQDKDYVTLTAIFSEFSTPGSWLSVGQGEQRSLASHFIQKAVSTHSLLS